MRGEQTTHEPATSISEELLHAIARRAGRPDYARFDAQLRSSGYCARPVRLQGHIETCEAGGRRRIWSTDTEPEGSSEKRAATAAKPSARPVRNATTSSPR